MQDPDLIPFASMFISIFASSFSIIALLTVTLFAFVLTYGVSFNPTKKSSCEKSKLFIANLPSFESTSS